MIENNIRYCKEIAAIHTDTLFRIEAALKDLNEKVDLLTIRTRAVNRPDMPVVKETLKTSDGKKLVTCIDCGEELITEQEDDKEHTLRCNECLAKLNKESDLEEDVEELG